MARQCLIAAIMHQPEAGSSASADKGLYLSRILVLSMDAILREAKCEELDKIVIDDDSEKIFQVEA